MTVVSLNPISVVKVRIQASRTPVSIINTVRNVLRSDGILGKANYPSYCIIKLCSSIDFPIPY